MRQNALNSIKILVSVTLTENSHKPKENAPNSKEPYCLCNDLQDRQSFCYSLFPCSPPQKKLLNPNFAFLRLQCINGSSDIVSGIDIYGGCDGKDDIRFWKKSKTVSGN